MNKCGFGSCEAPGTGGSDCSRCRWLCLWLELPALCSTPGDNLPRLPTGSATPPSRCSSFLPERLRVRFPLCLGCLFIVVHPASPRRGALNPTPSRTPPPAQARSAIRPGPFFPAFVSPKSSCAFTRFLCFDPPALATPTVLRPPRGKGVVCSVSPAPTPAPGTCEALANTVG